MPLFGFSSPGLASPSPSSMPFGESSSQQQQSPSASVQLSCLSPDGRSVYSLNANNRELETHTLPLAGMVQDIDDDDHLPSSIIIRTPLPDHVVSALRRYPAIELLCVDVDRDRGTTSLGLKRLSSLCLYSKKDVFLLEIGYTPSSELSGEVQGTCLSVSEPFDAILLGNLASINIIKIRQAPQQVHGYVTICPPEAMAMLTHDTTINEYSLTLYHGGDAAGGSSSSSSSLSTPLVYGVEQLDEQMDRLTDFVFLQSTAFSLLSNLSVGFLKATGEVFQASPILFRGTVVPQETVTQSLHYLQTQMDKYVVATARGRQVRSARQYLVDCFQQANTRGRFVSGQERSPAFEWPAQMQGPVLLLPESSDDSECRAICMEIVPAGQLCGLAIGYDGYQVEFGLISPTLLIPRFQLENPQDTLALDQELKWGAIVTRVDLREDDEESDHHPSCPCLALVRDPIMDTVLHYVTPTAIKSISTNALKVTANRLTCGNDNSNNNSRMFSPNSKGREVPIKTTGWSCLDVSTVDGVPKSVVGVVVSGDVQFGHVLVARLSNGTMIAINLTETRQIQEMEAISDMQSETLAIAARPDAAHTKELQALHDTPALADVAKPLMEKAILGLRSMGKIVGSATAVDQITPDMLAAAAHIKEQTDKEVLLPLIELHEHVRARKKEIVVMFNNQMSQVKSLREMVAKLKERETAITEKLEIIRDNSNSMAARSATVLQAAHDLQPTITQAEFDYFQELERLQVRAKQWQQQLDHLKVGASTLVDSIEKGTIVPFSEIPEDTHTNLVAMLHGCDTYIEKYTKRVKEQEICIDELAALAGWDRDPHGEEKLGQ